MPNYRPVIYNNIREVDAAAWNSLCKPEGDPFMDPRFLEAVERGMAADARFWHVVFFDDEGRAAASTSLCSYRVDAALLADGFLKKIATPIGRKFPRLMSFRVMFCGLCFSAGQSHLRFAAGADTGAILRHLDEILVRLTNQENAKMIVFKEFSAADLGALDALLSLGYHRADSLPMNHLAPSFSTFDEYLCRQKSARRYTIRKAQKKFETAGLRVVQMLGGEGADAIFTDDVYRLFETVFDRAKVKLEKVTPEIFRELARQLPRETAWTFVYKDDRVVAFATSLFTSQSYHQMFVGYDAALNPECDLYFNVFFHAIDRAYRARVEVIHVGQSADDFKHQKLNCHQRPLYFYIKGGDRLAKWILARFGKIMFPPRSFRPESSAAVESKNAELNG